MNGEPTVVIRFDGETLAYMPGETLSGEYWVESHEPERVKAIEASVLWYTEGKGDEDMAVHEFWRRDADEYRLLDLEKPERFSTVLPNSPLSYEGQIIKVRWVVRVRVIPHRGKEVVGEKAFELGNVAPIRRAAGAPD